MNRSIGLDAPLIKTHCGLVITTLRVLLSQRVQREGVTRLDLQDSQQLGDTFHGGRGPFMADPGGGGR